MIHGKVGFEIAAFLTPGWPTAHGLLDLQEHLMGIASPFFIAKPQVSEADLSQSVSI
jgi:hypothetical protein